ncbi:MAG: hypothetical protein JWP52_3244 [Rhizobacter sp.]|nr:hypothetical protein [Rhizobacter sp.]
MNTITTLIPAYKTQYLVELLTSLRVQTRPSPRIIISDDSPNGAFREVLYSKAMENLRAGLNIEFHEGPRSGSYENFKQLLTLWDRSSELVHVMLDDDVMYPDFYERHLTGHASGDYSCSISRRWSANEAGQPCAGQPIPPAVARHNDRMIELGPDVMFLTTVGDCKNWFGEFSNAIFRADCTDILFDLKVGDVSFAGLWDLGAFVAASLRRPVCYIQDYLGYFRISAHQNSSKMNSPLMKGAILGFAALAIGARRIGRLSTEQAQKAHAMLAPAVAMRYAGEADMLPFLAAMPALAAGEADGEARFLAAWARFQADNGF